MGLKAPLQRVAEAAALLSGLSYLVRPVQAALATTCYVDWGSTLSINELDFACGVVNDTSVGFLLSRDLFNGD